MRLKGEFDTAFEAIQRDFPFDHYIDLSTYYQSYRLTRALRVCLPNFQGKRLLDIGCGPMDKTAILQRLGFSCYAVDDLSDPWHLRDENTRRIKEFARQQGIEFHHQPQHDFAIPFEPESFDVVCALGVIEHLHESPRSLLNTMGRYLRGNGLLVLAMPNAVNLRKRLSVLAGNTNYVPVDQYFHSVGAWRGHVREYTLSETVYICREAGFEVVAASTYEALAQIKLKPPVRQIYQFLTKLIPGSQSGLLVIGRKPQNWQAIQPNPEAFRQAIARSVPSGVT